MTHTPGPWIENEQLRHDGTSAGTGFDIWTNSEQAHYVGSATRRDNARLIAAAPAMLKALQRITHPMADDDDLAHALEVIRQATGS